MAEVLVARVARWAREIPSSPAFTFVDYLGDGARHTLTWGQADLRARALAVRLREVAGPGDRAAVLAPQGLDYIVAMLGCMYAKVIAVPLFAPDLPGHADRLARSYADADPAIVLTTSAVLPGVETFLAQGPAPKQVIMLDTVSSLLADEWEPVELASSDLAYLQYTSGSTRAPAGVEITHGNVTANAMQLWEAFDARPRTSTAGLWLPLFHDMGMIATIALPIVGGNHVTFMDPVAFVMRPVRWLQLLSGVPDVFTGGPNFAFEYAASRVTPEELAALDLSGVRVMLNGAEPVRPATVRRFNEVFGPCGLRPEAVTPAYGLAEATVFVSATHRDQPMRVTSFDRDALGEGRAVPSTGVESVLVSHGVPTGQEVRIGNGVPDGVVGEIRVRGENVARAYWRDQERSAEVFVDGWLRTGDLGVIHEGELYITGRLKDLIIVDGRNHYPQDIEVTVQDACDAVRRDHVAAFAVPGEETERLVIVAERSRRSTAGADEVAAVIRAAVARKHDLSVHDVVLAEAGAVPRTSSGKIARRACLQAYLEGAFV